MDALTLIRSDESRGRSLKAPQHAGPHPANYIDADMSLGRRDHTDRREQRLVRKKKAESHEHYLCIVRDDNGTWSVRSSDSLRPVKKLVLADSMVHIENIFTRLESRLDDVEDEQIPQSQLKPPPTPISDPRPSTISYPFYGKRRRAASESTVGGVQSETHLSTSELVPGAEPGQPKTDMGRKKPRRDRVMLQIRMDERDKWLEWMRNAFKAIQQTACRSIAKEWIKAIHPKKQSTHPYNGNMPRNTKKSPDRTRPPYWPPHIRHKEPDHIDKAARTELLTWLLMNTPQPEIVPEKDRKTDKSFTAKDLLSVLEQKQDEFVVPRMELIRDVINVRNALEGFEEGGTDGDATMDVVDWSENFRSIVSTKKKRDDPGSTTKTEDEIESNDQDDEDTSGGAAIADVSEDDNTAVEAPKRTTEVETNASFSANTSPQDADIPPERPARLQHLGHYHHMSTDHHGFNISSGQVEQEHMHHNHPMPFAEHHILPNDEHFGHQNWSVTSAPTPGMTGSFDENMIIVQPPVSMIEQNSYETGVAMRPRTIRGMVSANPFHGNQHYTYQMNQDIQASYHVPHINGTRHDRMHHEFDDEIYTDNTQYGGPFMP